MSRKVEKEKWNLLEVEGIKAFWGDKTKRPSKFCADWPLGFQNNGKKLYRPNSLLYQMSVAWFRRLLIHLGYKNYCCKFLNKQMQDISTNRNAQLCNLLASLKLLMSTFPAISLFWRELMGCTKSLLVYCICGSRRKFRFSDFIWKRKQTSRNGFTLVQYSFPNAMPKQ